MRRSIRAPRSPAFTRSAPAFGLGLARRCITRSCGPAHKSLPGATCEIVSSARTRKLKAHCVTSTSSSAKKTDLLLRQTRLHFPRFEEAKVRSEEHTSELQSRQYLVCRLLLEK